MSGSAVRRATRVALIPVLLASAIVAASTATQAATTQVNDDATAVTYSPGWTQSTGLGGYYGADAHYSGTAGATVTLTFTGTTATWIGAGNSDHGRADVAICDAAGTDCAPATMVDTYAARSTPGQALFTAAHLSQGTHTLKITVRSDTSGTGHYVDVDAFRFGIPAGPLSGVHYVDNSPGSACSNDGPGTSAASPWCDFANLNGQTFSPGAQVLLKRGATFSGELGKLYGSGTASAPIVLGAYGSGARPHITGNGRPADRGVWIEDASHWTVRDLELSHVGAGLVFWYTTNGHKNISVADVYTHDVLGVFAGSPLQADLPGMYHSAGILITGNVPVTASESAITGVALTRLEGYNNNDDVDIAGFNADSGGQQGFLSTVLGHHSVSDVSLTESYFHHNLSGENFDNLQNMTITGMRLDDTGHGGNAWGTTALFFWSSSNVSVTNSILNGEASTNSPDQSETDLEAFNDHISFRGNYFGNSAGAPIEILEIPGRYSDNYQREHEISGNLFTSYGSGEAVFDGTFNTPMNFSGIARDNLYAKPGSTFTNGLEGWVRSSGNSGYVNDDAHFIGTTGETATYSFSGTTVTWIGGKNSDHGKANVAVCDAKGAHCAATTTVDTYAPSATAQRPLYTASGLANGTHTLKITVRADSSGAGHYTDVDAFTSGTPGHTSTVNDTDLSIKYSHAWTLTYNLAVSQNTAYNAAFDFADTQGMRQWRAQYYTPTGGWHDITPYDNTNQRWGNNGYVSRFALKPDTCATCPIARAWIAPTAGTIAIRGRVLKEALGGDGVSARITRNGNQVWPTKGGTRYLGSSDKVGHDTTATLVVSPGDVVRFEVTDGGNGDATSDTTAWSPSIAYL